MPATRRGFLTTGGAAAAASLAGCSTGEPTPMVDFYVRNLNDERQSFTVEVLPADIENDLSEDHLFERSFDLGPDGSENDTVTVSDAFSQQAALVRVRTGRGTADSYRYVPDCDASSARLMVGVRFHGIDDVRFTQPRCYH